MRGQKYMTVAVRAPDQEIVTKTAPLPRRIYQARIARIPVLRGTLLLWDALVLGFQALSFSADIALTSEEEPKPEPKDGPGTQWFTWLTAILGIGVGIGLFFVLPASLTVPIHAWTESAPLANLVEGLIRIVLLIGYIAVIGRFPDIRRVYMYHGAEHKAINAFEGGGDLQTARVQQFSTRHPRCGTTFLLVIAVLSVAVFTVIGRPESWLLLLGSRVLFVPVIAGLGYEIIRWAAAHTDRPWVVWVMGPGMALQTLSTREPEDSQVEVAVHALRELIRLETAVPA